MLDHNSITGNATEVCKLNPQDFVTDCEVVCPCCSECCQEGDDACSSKNKFWNYEPTWESGYKQDGYEWAPTNFVPAN
jgi:hypothetical protein